MTKEQSDILKTVSESILRVNALARKAASIECAILAGDLGGIAKQLEVALDLQSRVLSDDPKIREAAIQEAFLPFRIV